MLTSCNRFDLLRHTLQSFFAHNTYPLKEIILIEDSPRKEVVECIPEHAHTHTRILTNDPPIGQNAAIDRAYRYVSTPYIFHCEDDWLFYRAQFIEQSLAILQANAKILSVWLRDYANDLYYQTQGKMYLGEKQTIGDSDFFEIKHHTSHNHCVSFNPGLRRRSDYPPEGYVHLVNQRWWWPHRSVETFASHYYMQRGYYSVVLQDPAAIHIGWDRRIRTTAFRRLKNRDRWASIVIIVLVFLFGYWLGTR